MLQDLAEQKEEEEQKDQEEEPQQEAPEATEETAAPVAQEPEPTAESKETKPETTTTERQVVTRDPLDGKTLDPAEIRTGGVAVAQDSTGDLLMSENADATFEAGQFTDLMTLYTVLTDPAYAPTTQVLWQGGLELYPRYGQGTAITTDDAMHLLLYEGNAAAAAALAETYGPGRDAFTQKMNQKAKALGMNKTTYHSCLSFQEGQTTTVEDTLKLVEKLSGLADFNAMVEQNAYTVSVPTLSGESDFDNPAHRMQDLAAEGMKQIRYYRLTAGDDDGVMAAAVGKTESGETLYAATFDATASAADLDDEWLGAHVLRTFLEEGAAQVGAGGETPTQETTQTQVVAPVETTPRETAPTTTAAPLPEVKHEEKGLGWPFYLVLVILVLALVGLIVAIVMGAKKRARREQQYNDPYGYGDDPYYDDDYYDDGYYDDQGYSDDGYDDQSYQNPNRRR